MTRTGDPKDNNTALSCRWCISYSEMDVAAGSLQKWSLSKNSTPLPEAQPTTTKATTRASRATLIPPQAITGSWPSKRKRTATLASSRIARLIKELIGPVPCSLFKVYVALLRCSSLSIVSTFSTRTGAVELNIAGRSSSVNVSRWCIIGGCFRTFLFAGASTADYIEMTE